MTSIEVLDKIKYTKDNNLTRLDLSYYKLTKIPKEINELTQLEYLLLDNNQITKIEGLETLTQLEYLLLDNNQITKIGGLETLTQLKYLALNNNQITKIGGLETLTQLKYLALNNNQITKIEGIENLTQLEYLYFDNNQITKIEGLENLILLKTLYLHNNQITKIEGIENLTLLQYLEFHNNQIIKIEGLENLILLKTLYLHNNQITKIEGLENITLLQYLVLNNNQITKIEGLDLNIQLTGLILHNNQITKIERLENLILLKTLYFNNNQITKIEGLENNTQLTNLYFCNNQITQIPLMITNLPYLKYFEYQNNEIDYIPPQVTRFLNRMNGGNQVYADTQSVHNHNIQECIRKGIEYISSIKPSLTFEEMKEDILNNVILEEQCKNLLFEYCECKDVHSLLNITFEELLLTTYSLILNNENKDEIFKVMNDEMKDSQCKCFTGRMSRLVNCLNGFDSNISINISDNEQISTIIILTRERFDDIKKIKEEVRREMKERGYNEDIINEWIDYIE